MYAGQISCMRFSSVSQFLIALSRVLQNQTREGRGRGRERGPHLLGDDERHGSSMVNDGFLESDLLLERQRRVQVQRQLASGEDAHCRLQTAPLPGR